ncbi:MAG TPA: rRNA maturation RNase YbeY [Clostridia bacterium]|nr:rRNA maturation RNase YbeY [Clostridia bacterium]
MSFLAVHGTLHLLGYDHMEEPARAQMFQLQDKILDKMGIGR